jgi:hypothetical protein
MNQEQENKKTDELRCLGFALLADCEVFLHRVRRRLILDMAISALIYRSTVVCVRST